MNVWFCPQVPGYGYTTARIPARTVYRTPKRVVIDIELQDGTAVRRAVAESNLEPRIEEDTTP
jgi:putative ubiquitin-RnfH superfamily antitoxin RatB of RatAB toxin-antitoxin module